jgi:hypothetical protein
VNYYSSVVDCYALITILFLLGLLAVSDAATIVFMALSERSSSAAVIISTRVLLSRMATTPLVFTPASRY